MDALTSKVMNFVLKSDDNYTLDIADAELCESEYYHLLRIVGAHMDEFKNSPLKIYFDSSQHLFEKTIRFEISQVVFLIFDIKRSL
jgi:hypothetical protein